MITQVLCCCLWLNLPQSGPLSELSPLATGRTVTHLKSFFDPRSLGVAEPVYLETKPSEPSILLLEPLQRLTGTAAAAPTQSKPAAIEAAAPIVAEKRHALVAQLPAISPNTPKRKTVVAGASAERVVATETAKSPENTPISLHCSKAPLSAILTEITRQTHVDLLLMAPEGATLTLDVNQRRFIDVLRDICAMEDLSYLKVGNSYVVATDDKLKAAYPDAYSAVHAKPIVQVQPGDEIITESYRTNCVDANKLVDPIKQAFKDDNLVLIPAPAQIMPTLGQQDTSNTGMTTSQLQADLEALKVSRQLVIRGPRGEVAQVLEMIRGLDVAPAQVNIAVAISEVSNDALRELGLEWSFGSGDITFVPGKGVSFANGIQRTPIDFNYVIKALETKNQAKVLSTPNISVLDGQRAYILVGQRLSYPVVIQFNQNGSPVFNKEEQKVGIYLQVSPWIAQDGKIRLMLHPQVSTITGFVSVNGGQYPQVATREGQTTMTVESGKTVIMGGLIDDNQTYDVQKVPLLGDIPILGEFFTRRHKTHNRTQLVITITPTIMNPGS